MFEIIVYYFITSFSTA